MISALSCDLVPVTCSAPTRAELEAAFAEFLRLDVASGDASAATVRSYRAEVAAWVRWCETRGIDPAKATTADVKRLRQELVERDYKPITVRWKLSILRRFYQAAVNAGFRKDNPVSGVRSPRVRHAAEDFKFLSGEQLERLLVAVGDPAAANGRQQVRRLRDLLMVALMGLHGLRTIELHRGSVEDLTVRGGYTALLVRGKTRDRLVFLRADTAETLSRYLELRGEVARDELGTPLFVALDRAFKGHRLSRRHIRSTTDNYLRVAGLKRPGISNHALRHTAATLGYLHTGDLRAVQELLGHSDPRTTARYAHVVDMARRNPALFIPINGG
jgi:site-specific recombinase XerD